MVGHSATISSLFCGRSILERFACSIIVYYSRRTSGFANVFFTSSGFRRHFRDFHRFPKSSEINIKILRDSVWSLCMFSLQYLLLPSLEKTLIFFLPKQRGFTTFLGLLLALFAVVAPQANSIPRHRAIVSDYYHLFIYKWTSIAVTREPSIRRAEQYNFYLAKKKLKKDIKLLHVISPCPAPR